VPLATILILQCVLLTASYLVQHALHLQPQVVDLVLLDTSIRTRHSHVFRRQIVAERALFVH
jgi:hypothetical protein